MPMSGGNVQLFRRMTQAVLIPVGPTASNAAVPNGWIMPGYNAFAVYNPNLCAVELRGAKAGDAAAATSGQGIDWLFPPGFWDVFATQTPTNMSAQAIEVPGFPLAGLTYSPLRIWYGMM